MLIPFFIFNLACAWFQCEFGGTPPYIYTSSTNTDNLLETIKGPNSKLKDGPIAYTKLGPVQGSAVENSENEKIFSFTGIPYGTIIQRFKSAVPKKPWKGTLQATAPSPFCIQSNAVTMGLLRGQEDCLFLDIHTPRLPDPNGPKRQGMPVFVWIPAGANIYGRSRFYGPSYMLREDVIFVPINVRFGVFGYLATGDEASPGNYALKDQALAIEWVYQNIEAFGGDPTKIIVGGMSSGAYSAQMMLFTKHHARKYVAGIIAMSGSVMCNHGFDTKGRVQNSSDVIAEAAGCPTSRQGRSKEMVECLRKLDPYVLANHQWAVYSKVPPMVNMLGPSLEPDVPDAFISELPEVQYEKGTVAPIPVIFTRAEDEVSIVMERARYGWLPIMRLNWYNWMPQFLALGLRSSKEEKVSQDDSQRSLLKINQFYFNKSEPPRFRIKKEFKQFVNMIDDSFYNAPTWKGIELHQKVAPTYMYIHKHKTFLINPFVDIYQRLIKSDFGASHATEYVLLFNNSRSIPPLTPGSDFDRASRNLINMFANFGLYGKPLYRTPTGTLLNVWKPIEDMKRPMVLEVGLVHNISMIRDPLPGSRRLKIWDEVKF